jgi:hypothetical protein
MKRLLAIATMLLVVSTALTAGPISLATATGVINDNYLGVTPSGYTDVVGAYAIFNIDKMVVDYKAAAGALTVDIYSGYFGSTNAQVLGTVKGDLFISTNGYTIPANSANDNMYSGERWEYALKIKDNGLANLVAVNKNIISSDGYMISKGMGNYNYRHDQEVQVGSGAALAGGTWETLSVANGSTTDRILQFSVESSLLKDLKDLGFHWAMTCGNDVIEGGVASPVPEPATLSLLGLGIAAMAGFMKRRKNAR